MATSVHASTIIPDFAFTPQSYKVFYEQSQPAGMSEDEEEEYDVLEEDDSSFLDPKYQEVIVKYGRVFQRYAIDEEIYYVPIDPEEEERLGIQHNVVTRFLDDKLIHCPLTAEPTNILDCGYGQGEWAKAVAEQYPTCEVTGIDINPLDLLEIPHNVNLESEDLNNRLTEVYPLHHYDLIQSRFVSGGIGNARWPSYVQELTHLLKPGGWLQMIEFYYNFQSHAGLLNPSHALYEWGTKFRRASELLDRSPRVGSMTILKDMLERAGLGPVAYRNCSVPVGGWSRDPRERGIGLENIRNIDRMLESLGTWPFCSVLGMSMEEVVALNNRAKQELRDSSLKLYLPMTLCYGQKQRS